MPNHNYPLPDFPREPIPTLPAYAPAEVRNAARFIVTLEADTYWRTQIDRSGSLGTDLSGVEQYPATLHKAHNLNKVGLSTEDVAEISDDVRETLQNEMRTSYLQPVFEPIGDYASREDFEEQVHKFLFGQMAPNEAQAFVGILREYILSQGLDQDDYELAGAAFEEGSLSLLDAVYKIIDSENN